MRPSTPRSSRPYLTGAAALVAQHLTRRRTALNQAVFLRPLSTRMPRVISYVRTTPGTDPDPVFTRLRGFARLHDWHVGHELYDTAGDTPQESIAWQRARRLMHEGFADGVVVPDRSHISGDDRAYLAEIEFVGERQCFTALLVPESEL
ncbi:hypothetical protein [Streptomyces qinzhouensis]|uniref:Recombinase family protein n=1 Tax=Streptomyces qinzhouensis TaxID=2599401 RepID=A0A5B8JIV7_9ACTN|nr:hypothetical protein [Streptomyces qinzhouensis]QDY77423.1 hypothetical protein FQU76_13815 [Streptomyces qinzhouensis]